MDSDNVTKSSYIFLNQRSFALYILCLYFYSSVSNYCKATIFVTGQPISASFHKYSYVLCLFFAFFFIRKPRGQEINLSCIPGFLIISTFSQIRHRNYGLEFDLFGIKDNRPGPDLGQY